MRLTYWYCPVIGDAMVYSIRAKTKREAKALREEYGEDRFDPPLKNIVTYSSAFDLMDMAMGSDRLGEESNV